MYVARLRVNNMSSRAFKRSTITLILFSSSLHPQPSGLLSGVMSFVFRAKHRRILQNMSLSRIAELFKAHGVKSFLPVWRAYFSNTRRLQSMDIKVVDVRHEVNAVFAADAVARVSGVPGVAIVTAGPGVTNTITAIKNAEMAESPLVLIGGASPIMLKGQGALQDINQREVIEPIVKKCWSVTTVRDILPTLREAFRLAKSGTPGPVFVELPIDILYSYLLIAANTGLVVQKSKSTITSEDIPNIIFPRIICLLIRTTGNQPKHMDSHGRTRLYICRKTSLTIAVVAYLMTLQILLEAVILLHSLVW